MQFLINKGNLFRIRLKGGKRAHKTWNSSLRQKHEKGFRLSFFLRTAQI